MKGLDIAEILAREPWVTLRWRVTQKKEHPTKKELADAIRKNPSIPADMADYVAGRLDGSIQPPRHRPAKRATESNRRMRAQILHWHVQLFQAAFRIQKVKRPKEEALRVVVKQHPLAPGSPETLRDLLKGVHDPWPISEAETEVRKMKAEGSVRLDKRMGLVFTQDEANTA